MRITAVVTICSLCIILLECIHAEEQQSKPLTINKPFRIFNSGHKRSVSGVAFSPDGKLLASASDVAQIWDVSTGNKLMTIAGDDVGFFDVKFAPDGKTLALPGFYGNIQIWNVKTNKLNVLLKGHEGRIFSVDYNSTGKLLASGGGPDHKPGRMKVWKLASGDEITDLDKEHPGDVNSVAFSPNGKILASASRNLVRIWNVDTGTLKKTFHVKETTEKHQHIFALAFSPDGKFLASGDSNAEINVWDLKTSSLKYRLSGHANNITSLAFSPNGKTLASAGSYDHTARIWNLISGKLVIIFKSPKEVDCVAFSPDGKLLATGGGTIGNGGIVCLWKVPVGE